MAELPDDSHRIFHRRSASDSMAIFENPARSSGIPTFRPRGFGSFDAADQDDDESDTKSYGVQGNSVDFDAQMDDDLNYMASFLDSDERPMVYGIAGVPLGRRSGTAVGRFQKRPSGDFNEQLKRSQSAGVSGGSLVMDVLSPSESMSEVSNDGQELKPDLRIGVVNVKAELEVQSTSGDEDQGGGGLLGSPAAESPSNLSHVASEFLEQAAADGVLDPKRAKRILANRQSAQRSRVRKLQYISELERKVSILQGEIGQLKPKVTFLDRQRLNYNSENSALKQRMAEMTEQTRFKNAVNEALRKEVQRLRSVHLVQHQAQLQQAQQGTTTQAPCTQTLLAGGVGGAGNGGGFPPLDIALHRSVSGVSTDGATALTSLGFDFASSLGGSTPISLPGSGSQAGGFLMGPQSLTSLNQALSGLNTNRSSLLAASMAGLSTSSTQQQQQQQQQQLFGGGGIASSYMVTCGNAGPNMSSSMSDLVMHNA